MILFMLLALMFANAEVNTNTQHNLKRKLLDDMKDWIFDIQNKPFPQSCQKHYQDEGRNIEHKEIVKKVACNQVGVKTK